MAALVNTFESASRFECADESSAQATISIDIVTLSCRSFSLVYLLPDCAFGAAIRIAYGDHDDGDEDGRDDVRSAVKSGCCCAAKTAPPNITFALRALQHPLRPATQFPKKTNRLQSAVRAAEAAAMIDCRRFKRPEDLSRLGRLRYRAKFNNPNIKVLWSIESKIMLS